MTVVDTIVRSFPEQHRKHVQNPCQGVKWEDTSKKEEKRGHFTGKGGRKEDIFFFKLNTTEARKHQIYM